MTNIQKVQKKGIVLGSPGREENHPSLRLTVAPVSKVKATGSIFSTSSLQSLTALLGPGRCSHRLSISSIIFLWNRALS